MSEQNGVSEEVKNNLRTQYREGAKSMGKKIGDLSHEDIHTILQNIFNTAGVAKESFIEVFKREIASAAANGFVIDYGDEDSSEQASSQYESPAHVDNRVSFTALKIEKHIRNEGEDNHVALCVFDQEEVIIVVEKSAKIVAKELGVELQDIIAVDEEYNQQHEIVGIVLARASFDEKEQVKLIRKLSEAGMVIKLCVVSQWKENGKADLAISEVEYQPEEQGADSAEEASTATANTTDEHLNEAPDHDQAPDQTGTASISEMAQKLREGDEALRKMEEAAEGPKENVTVEEKPKAKKEPKTIKTHDAGTAHVEAGEDFAKEEEGDYSFIETITDAAQVKSVIKTMASNNLVLIRKKTGHRCSIVDAHVDEDKNPGRLFYEIKTDGGRIVYPYTDKVLKHFNVINV